MKSLFGEYYRLQGYHYNTVIITDKKCAILEWSDQGYIGQTGFFNCHIFPLHNKHSGVFQVY